MDAEDPRVTGRDAAAVAIKGTNALRRQSCSKVICADNAAPSVKAGRKVDHLRRLKSDPPGVRLGSAGRS